MNNCSFQHPDNFLTGETSISGAKILKEPVHLYQKEILYITTEACTPADSSGSLPRNILFIGSDENPFLNNQREIKNSFTIKSEKNLSDLLDDVLDAITYYRNLFDRLLTASLEGQGLSKMLDIASIHFENPVAVYDRSMKLLAYSSVYSINDDFWIETTKKGYLDFSGSDRNKLKEYLQLTKNNNNSLIYRHSNPNHRFISKNIMVLDHSAAMLHIVEKNTTLTCGSLDAAASISAILSIEIERNNLLHYKKGILHEQLIIDLLEKKIANMQELNARAKNIGWHFSNYFCCLTVVTESEFLTDEQLAHALTELNQIITSSKGIIYNGSILLIINTQSNKLFNSTTTNALRDFLDNKKLFAGLSRFSARILDIPELYSQAVHAIKIGSSVNPQKRFYPYSEFSLFAFYDDCLQNDNIKNYYHPALDILNAYDEKNHTDLMITLRHYVNNRNNQVKTASQLYIHRTTLLHRVKKIEEVMNVDLDDPDTNFHILLSFRLSEYNKLLIQNI